MLTDVQKDSSLFVEVVGDYLILFIWVKFRQRRENDHTNMTAPLPVCSAKLSMFGPG